MTPHPLIVALLAWPLAAALAAAGPATGKPGSLRDVGSGRGRHAATTRDAERRQAYVLMDRATYLTLEKEITLQVLVERDPALLNYLAVIRVDPARLPGVNGEGARAFQDWLVSDEAQRIIQVFGVDRYGELLFFPNSDEWRKRHGGAS